MTPRTPQCEVFCPLLWSSTHSGVPEDSQPPTFPSVGLHPHTWPKWGCNNLGVIEKFLKLRYRKWPRIGHSDIFSPSYGQKKGRESNSQFDSRPLKVKNWPLCDVASESATCRWKDLDEGYSFGSDLIAIGLYSRELWPFEVRGVQPGQFRDSISGVPTKCAIWM